MGEDAHLLDTNILLRLFQPQDLAYGVVRRAIRALRARSVELFFTLQNVAEFWNVCTRPIEHNGLGLSVTETDRRARLIEKAFTLLADSERVYQEWRELVVVHGITGIAVHDARLVAAMKAHGLTSLLTLNQGDFVRYPDIKVVHPSDVVSAP